MFASGTKGWLSGAVLLSLALVACGGSTEEGSSGGGGQAGTGGTGGTAGSGGTAGTGGSAGQAGTGGAAGQAGSGGSAGQAGSGGSAGQAGSGGAAGAAGQSGDCDDSVPNLVCPDNGSTCTELVPGGFTVCALTIEEATTCTSSGMDDCCDSSECTEGACFPYPSFPSCGGAQPPEMNVCASDLCENDSDCQGVGDQFCAPRGVNNNAVRYCMPKACTTDADCSAKAGGQCAPVRNPCCGSWTGLFCVYPDGCRTDADCNSGQYCDVNWDEGTGECMDGGPMCPA